MKFSDVDVDYTPPARRAEFLREVLGRRDEVLAIVGFAYEKGVGLVAGPRCRVNGVFIGGDISEARQAFEKVQGRFQSDPQLHIAAWMGILMAARSEMDMGPSEAWEYATRRLHRVATLEEPCSHENLFKVGGREMFCPVCAGEDPPQGAEPFRRSDLLVS